MAQSVTFRCPADLLAFVDKVAAEQGVTRTEVIVAAISLAKRTDERQ